MWVVNLLLQLPCLLPAVSTLMSWTTIQLEAQAHINLLELPWSRCLYHNNGKVANSHGFYFPWSWLRTKSPAPVAFCFDFPLERELKCIFRLPWSERLITVTGKETETTANPLKGNSFTLENIWEGVGVGKGCSWGRLRGWRRYRNWGGLGVEESIGIQGSLGVKEGIGIQGA